MFSLHRQFYFMFIADHKRVLKGNLSGLSAVSALSSASAVSALSALSPLSPRIDVSRTRGAAVFEWTLRELRD